VVSLGRQRPASIPASAPVPRVRPGRVGMNPPPECHGSEAALRGDGDLAQLPDAPAEDLGDIEPDPARVAARGPVPKRVFRPQPAPRTLRMTAPRDALSHDL
jgi:hypothetical protein